MQGLNRQLIGILRDRRDVYVRLGETFIIELFGPEWVAENNSAAGQMIDGALALFVEGLEGRGNAVRSFYQATLITSLVEDGTLTPEDIIAHTARYIMLMVHDAVEQLPAESRDAAMQWFARFSGHYFAEVASVALGVKAQRP